MPDIPRSDNGSVSGADYSNPKDPFGARLTGPFGHAVSIGLTPCSDSLRFATRPTLPGHSLYNAQLSLSYQGLRELSRLAVQAIGKVSANLSLELGRVDWAMNADFSSAPHRAPGRRSLLSPANPQASVSFLFLHLTIIRMHPSPPERPRRRCLPHHAFLVTPYPPHLVFPGGHLFPLWALFLSVSRRLQRSPAAPLCSLAPLSGWLPWAHTASSHASPGASA